MSKLRVCTFLSALVLGGIVNAAPIEVTGGSTFVQLDGNVLRTLGLEITDVTGADLLSMPGFLGFPINSREDTPPTTFVFDSETLSPFSGTFEHTGTITFNEATTVGDFQIAYSESRPEGSSGFFVRTTLSDDDAENIPMFDLPALSDEPGGTTADFGTDFFNVDGALLVAPELATFFGDEGLSGATIGSVKNRSTAQPVPEPSSLALICLAGIALMRIRSRS